jgi:DNA-binding MarR family transcriptional regulator
MPKTINAPEQITNKTRKAEVLIKRDGLTGIEQSRLKKNSNLDNTEKLIQSASNYELWLLMTKIHHYVILVRHKELIPYNIPPQQLEVLRTIKRLGENVTLSKLANELERQHSVISRQAVGMEKDGLIKRTEVRPKSRLLKIELTQKGYGMLNIRGGSKLIDKAWSFLTEDERQGLYSVLSRMSTKLKKLAST